MATRRPLALVSGRQKELPVGDTMDWDWLTNFPVVATNAPLVGGASLQNDFTLDLDLMLLEEVSL